jgi:cystathionine beta-lyase
MAGLATSYLIIPEKALLDRYNHMLNDELHLSGGNLPGTVALEAAYNKGSDWLSQLLGYLQRYIRLVVEFCKNYLPAIIPIIPESTYMVWLDCRNLGFTDEELNEFFIRKARLGLNEGRQFGPGGEGFMRMNIACPRSVVLEALQRLKHAI